MEIWEDDQKPIWFDRNIITVGPANWSSDLPEINITLPEDTPLGYGGEHTLIGMLESQELSDLMRQVQKNYHPDFEGKIDIEPIEINSSL